MKNITTIFLIALLAVATLMNPALIEAQVTSVPQPTRTTLAAAVTSPASTSINFTAVTSFGAGDIVIIDHEAIQIPSNYVVGTNPVTNVTRGYNGTLATTHKNGATVLRSTAANVSNADFFGSCTAANQPHLPRISINRNIRDVALYGCNNGMWARQTLPDDVQQLGAVQNPACTMPTVTAGATPGYQQLGNSTTPANGTIFYGSVWVPHTMVLTGIRSMNGGTAGTDALIYTLHRADGVPVATTATAGTTASGTYAYQAIAFTSTYLATGPARYWIGVTANGNTTRLHTIPTASFISVLGSSQTSITFGTAPTLTLVSTLTANTAPIACVY